MKTMGKIITGVLIISVIYIYIKNSKKTTKKEKITYDICIQTDVCEDHLVFQDLDTINEENVLDVSTVIEEENNTIDEYIQKETSCIEEVENLSSPISQDNSLKNMNVIDLKELAKEQNIKGYSRMKKADLIEILS